MSEKITRFFGVDNGQSVLVTLDESTHILLDIKQRPEDAGDDDRTQDVQAHLLKVLKDRKRDGRRWMPVFCLSHGDRDHCQGADRVFYFPGGPTDEHLIGIDELWVVAELLREKLDGPAEVIQKEARRRLRLWADPRNHSQAELPGNRLVVFGHDEKDQQLARMPKARRPGAGDILRVVNGQVRSDFELFVHWPPRAALADPDMARNEKSLIGQFILRDGNAAAAFIFGGDAGCDVWRTLYRLTAYHNNWSRLDWNVFFGPHHCTYRFFTCKTGEEGRREAVENPCPECMAILKRAYNHGWVVCSSRPVRAANYDDDDPPHIEGVRHYVAAANAVGGKFVCLMQNPNERTPKGLILRLTAGGLQDITEQVAATPILGAATVSTTTRWGKRDSV
jgi:hypothetical protein